MLPYLDKVDLILVMTVEPGFGGQAFMADQLPKIAAIRRYIQERNPACRLEVDGGVDPVTARQVVEAGADVLVAGSAIYGAPDPAQAIRALRESNPGPQTLARGPAVSPRKEGRGSFMEYFPPALEKMVEQFARLPGIGHKTAQRLAFLSCLCPRMRWSSLLRRFWRPSGPLPSAPSVRTSRKERGCAPICASEKRDGSVVCVVADPKDVIAMERAREYHGTYHVLHGVLSPMNGVGPDDLYIKSLLDRVAQGEIQEVIMATNPDTEGEATAMYLSRMLKPFGVKVTRLAYGVPVGGHLEYADDATLMRALEGRREM